MKRSFRDFLTARQMWVNLVGLVLLSFLLSIAWDLVHPLTLWSLVPLGCVGYGFFRILFELTMNRRNIPTLAAGFAARKKMTEVLKHEASKKGETYTIIDLGSGRGELSRHIARAIPQARIIGVEIARLPYLQSKLIQRVFGPSNLSFKCLDFWSFDCSVVDAVILYLTPTAAKRVGEKLEKEMIRGGMIVSHTFPLLGSWTPSETLEFRTPFKETIYVYKKP